MPRFALFSGLAVWLASSGLVSAIDTVKYTGVVAHDNAEVRAGPTPELYLTNKLRQGVSVQVIDEVQGGWLKIVPPPGSFSWVDSRYAQQVAPNVPNNWMIKIGDGHHAQVIVGNDPTETVKQWVGGASLTDGAQVVINGPSKITADGTWLQIQPPATEFRYIRAEDVIRSDGPARPQAATTVAKPADPAVIVPGTASTDMDALWQRGQDAERAGRTAEAIDLYTQVGTFGQSTHNELAMQALNRARWLREGMRSDPAAAAAPPSHVLLSNPIVPSAVPPRPAPLAGPAPITINGPGVLRLAGRCWEGRRTYRLETVQGRPIVYATAEPGVDLEPYLNHKVELYGPTIYSGDLRANYMRVERVRPAP
jgi:hypothetical protein